MKMATKPQLSASEACNETRAIYQALAERPIERSCERRKDCCHFKLTGRTPLLTKGEAILAATALRQSGRTRLPSAPSGACPMLDVATGDCLIYESRPFGCRTHFCAAAGGPYARSEVLDLIRRLEDLDHRLGGDGVHKIERAIADALALSS
jgi:Fe-S-cluster containining protein